MVKIIKKTMFIKGFLDTKKTLTVEDLMERQDEILTNFTKKERKLVIEAINIEYKLAMVEQGYSLEDLDD